MPEQITVSEFLSETWDDYNSPTTSAFSKRMSHCRNTVSTLEEVCSISLFTVILAHAHKRFRTATALFTLDTDRVIMLKRECLNKLKIDALKSLATDKGINVCKKKKTDIINEILSCQVPDSILTPLVNTQNLPPYNTVRYSKPTLDNIPSIRFAQIYEFMIERPIAGGTANNFKGLDRAVKHYDAGDVQDIGVSQINGITYYVKANCHASMKKHQYLVYICLTRENGSSTILHGYCQCPIGLAQTCSHIGSLLFAVCNAKLQENPSCTSIACSWSVPSRTEKKLGPMTSLSRRKPIPCTASQEAVTDDSSILYYDPRHTLDRVSNLDETLLHLRDLKDVFPNTGMSHLWNISDHVPEAIQEEEIQIVENPMISKMNNMIYSDQNLPLLSIDQDLVDFIEMNTRGQRSSDMWQKLHIGRLTSSIFGEVLSAGPQPNSLIKRIVEGSNLNRYSSLPPAVKWGVEKEPEARADYINLIQSSISSQITVEDTGLTLSASHSFLGASSDGRVVDGDSIGVLEIKCPYSVKGTRVTSLEVCDIVAMRDPNFCLEESTEGPQLKRSHNYYAQIQGELAIMGLPWCDFVVWTNAPKNNICVDRVYFDEEFVRNMMPKLVAFYINHIAQKFYVNL